MWLFSRKNKASDEDLANEYYHSGNKALVGDLFERHVKIVFGVCLFYFRDREQAKDAVMHIFEKLISELRKSKVTHFQAWLSFVVRNYCISELRKKKGKYLLPESYLEFEVQESSLEEEEKIAGVTEERLLQLMKEALPQLKENQRLCVEAFYLDNRSYQEISERTGYSLNEVKSYIQNGKRNLKLIIEEKRNAEARK